LAVAKLQSRILESFCGFASDPVTIRLKGALPLFLGQRTSKNSQSQRLQWTPFYLCSVSFS
jgi:hypothetical protein